MSMAGHDSPHLNAHAVREALHGAKPEVIERKLLTAFAGEAA